MKINSSSIYFIGIFNYDIEYFKRHGNSNLYSASNYYDNNKDYLNSKYYPNWIRSIFGHSGDIKVKSQLNLDLNRIEETAVQYIEIPDESSQKSYSFKISQVKIYLFRENLAVFSIQTNLLGEYGFDDITIFCRHCRSTGQMYFSDENKLSKIIGEYITSTFHSQPNHWVKNNPNLKIASFIDVDGFDNGEERDMALYKTCTLTKSNDLLFEPDENYYQYIIDNNTIEVYRNWKVLCMYDSFTRIALNLDRIDKYRIWENEYINIYIHVLFTRYYLHYLNEQLAQLTIDLKSSKKIRDNYIDFLNEFQYSKISYKFLPNLLYEKFTDVLDVEKEKALIEQKVDRLNSKLREQSSDKINAMLLFLTIITLISVAADAGSIVSYIYTTDKLGIVYFTTSLVFILVCILILLVIRFVKAL